MTIESDVCLIDSSTKEKIAQFQRRLNGSLPAGIVDEVVQIVRFSDNLADQLGFDRIQFFKQNFWS